jgi:GNAT superfamily N-acetyltransferase
MIPRNHPSGTPSAAVAALRELSRTDRYATMKTGSEAHVRRAIAADASALAALRFAFRSSFADPVESRADFVARCEAWMQMRLEADTHWRAWVVDIDDAPVGNVWLQMIEKLPNPVLERELHAYVSNLFVLPEHRGRGAGGLLLSTLLAECQSLGVDTIFLWPTPESRTLYQRHGFAVTDSVMCRVL